MAPATTPSCGHPSGPSHATSRVPSPPGAPQPALWENPVFSGCWDKDEKGRGFLEGRAAGRVWGNTRQGLCCDKAPAGARGLESLSDKGNWGEPAPAALSTPKPPFILSAASLACGEPGTARVCAPPAFNIPWEVSLCAGHPPHLTTGAGIDAVPNPAAAAVLARLRARRLAGVMPAKSQRLHPPPVPWQRRGFREGGGRGDVVGALPCPRRSRGRRSRGRVAPALRAPQPVPAAGEAEWGSRDFGCPEGTGSALAWPPARCFPTPALPSQSWGQSWELRQVFSPGMGAGGMCPWRGGTLWGQWERWAWGHYPLPLVPFCPQIATLPALDTTPRAGGAPCWWCGAQVTRLMWCLAVPLCACPWRPPALF